MARAQKAAKPKGPVFHDVVQGSEDWFKLRLGLVTASMFGVVMAEGKDGGPSLTRTQLLHRLAGERLTGMPGEETPKTRAMERGKEMEPDAIADYVERTGADLYRVGFVTNFEGLLHCGGSPDALVGYDGGVETKTMRPDLMIPMLLKGASMLPEHRAQVQGYIWLCDRAWWDLKVFYPGMPNFTVRCVRDDAYIREMSQQIEKFNWDLDSLVQRLRKMGAA